MGSIHNELTGRSGFLSKAARNALQVESGEVGIERLSETLQPNIDLWTRSEWAHLRGERRWAQFNQVTSAAATLAVIGVINPANSGVLTVITDVFAYAAAAGVVINLETFVGLSGLGNTAPMFGTDLRGGNSQTRTLSTASALGAYGGHIWSQCVTLAANDIIDFVSPSGRVHEIVLPPATECVLAVNAVGVQTLSAVFVGYERAAAVGELTARA